MSLIFKNNVDDRIKRLLQGYYDVDYYTTADIELFMGDTKIEDVVSLEYSLVNNKTPIYGIFSRYYDAVAKGSIIVKGSIAIAFKQTNYLAFLYAQHMDATPYEIDLDNSKNSVDMAYELIAKYKDYKSAYRFFSDDLKNFVRALIDGEYDTAKKIYVDKILEGDYENRELDIYKLILKDYYWSSNLPENAGDFADVFYSTSAYGKNIKRADELDLEIYGFGYGMEYSTILTGFEIYITYGYNDNFKINKNVKLINDVHIISEAQSLQVTDEPIIEIYQFFARSIDVVNPITIR